jgi:N-acetylgalactosamine PTS system EIIA component
MKYLMMISHGELAPGLKSACEMMTGPRPELLYTNLPDGMSTATFEENFRSMIKPIDFTVDQLILLVDIMGGSPFSTAVKVLSDLGVMECCTILAGMNLPMAVTAVIMKDILDGEDFVNQVLNEGRVAVDQFVVSANNVEEEI